VGEITHLKLFVEGDRRRAALFSGTDEAQHWVRNVEAESVLSSGWHLLPKETLIAISDVQERGFWRQGVQLNPRAWRMRLINLQQRLADQAGASGDHRQDADQSLRAADQLQHLADDLAADDPNAAAELAQQAIGWRLRGSEALVALWQQHERDAQRAMPIALELVALFDLLGPSVSTGLGQEAQAHAERNARFWWQQAVTKAAQCSDEREQAGDLLQAAAAAQTVLDLATHRCAARSIAAS
jgi:hypothetical protein